MKFRMSARFKQKYQITNKILVKAVCPTVTNKTATYYECTSRVASNKQIFPQQYIQWNAYAAQDNFYSHFIPK